MLFLLPFSVTPTHQHRANTLEREPQNSRRVQHLQSLKITNRAPLKTPHEHSGKIPTTLQKMAFQDSKSA